MSKEDAWSWFGVGCFLGLFGLGETGSLWTIPVTGLILLAIALLGTVK